MASKSLIFLHIVLSYLMCFVTDVHPYIIKLKQDTTQYEKQDMPKCVTNDGHEGFCLLYFQCVNNTFDSKGIKNIEPKTAIKNSVSTICSDFRNLPRRCCVNTSEPTSLTMTPETFPSDREQQAQFDKLPWSVALFSKNRKHHVQDKTNSYFCSGSLIHPKLVLSAVHCLIGRKASEIEALIGAHNFKESNELTQKIEVTKIIKHEGYFDGNRNNDIALLVLKRGNKYNKNVRTVYLANQNSLVSDSSECYASYWEKDINGVYTSRLTKVKRKLHNSKDCNFNYNLAFKIYVNLPENSFCAISLNPDKCAADSGSPLICKAKNTKNIYIQYGVMSMSPCKKSIVSGVYADVKLFRLWIDAQVKQLGYDTSTYTYSGLQDDYYIFNK